MRAIATLICLSLCAPALAGQLAPPAGPVSSTMKSLVDVEPRTAITQDNTPGDGTAIFVITQPGSYYLTSNLTGVAGPHGIRVTASDVEIDLNGFTMDGVAGSSSGIFVGSTLNQIRIHSGAIKNWGGGGISANGANRCVARDLTISDNIGNGILFNNGYLVENVVCYSNTQVGIDVAFQGIVRNSISYFNSSNGFVSRGEALIENCIAFANGGHGFDLNTKNIIVKCSAISNGGTGITSSTLNQIISCSAIDNNTGIIVSSSSVVRNCFVRGNDGHGIILGTRSRAVGNSAERNGFGFASSFCGIITNGTDGVIDGNTVINNEIGICVPLAFSGWTVVRNIGIGSTTGFNYSIPGAFAAGAIVANPAVAGPWDNLSN